MIQLREYQNKLVDEVRNSFINGPFISFIEDLQKGCPQTAYIYNNDEFFEKYEF
jgi:hypothetical protein